MATEGLCLKISSRVISGIYILAGALKFPIVPSVYEDMSKKFVDYTSVFPGKLVGFEVEPLTYQYTVGLLEVALGLGLMLGSAKVKVICSGGLGIVMIGAVFTLTSIRNYGEAPFPAVLGASLFMLMHYYSQLGKKKID